jgi:hypothetical protein
MTDTPQSTYRNYQNLKVNIPKMYKHYITGGSTPGDNEISEIPGIDDVRATISVSTTGQTTTNLIKSLNISPTSTTPASTPNTATPVRQAQESRCHAFYRIIGFPVVTSDKSRFYNPGLDVIRQYDAQGNPIARKITLAEKIQIAENVDPKFESISQSREAYAAGTAAIFAVPNSVEAGVLALTSGTYGTNGSPNIRQFNAPFSVNTALDPFDFSIADQAYSKPGNIVSTSSLVGTDEVVLADYQDGNGVKPNISIGGYKILQQHEHIIVPFMVDPRIDFSIWANKSNTVKSVSRRIAVPFVPDASFQMAGSANFSDTPYLEKIITKRFATFNNTLDAGTTAQDIVDYVKQFKSIQDIKIGSTTISNIFSNNIFKLQEQDAFAKYLNKIQSMIDALSSALKVIHSRQGSYYWLPIPSQQGPEGGCTVRDVPININFNSDHLVNPGDTDIIVNQLNFFMTNINSGASQANSVPDIAGVNTPSVGFQFDSDTSDSEGDVTSNTKDILIKIRKQLLGDAGDALQTVEMIMGEFSGLGLCDIIAVLGALNVMPAENLLGFLDLDAYDRAKSKLGQSLPAKPDINTSMTSLASYVSSFYQIMDKMFLAAFGNNANDR